MKKLVIFFIIEIILCFPAWCLSDSFTQKDRELLVRLDERLNQIDKRFEQIDKRFEQIDKRFAELREDMNKRFEQVDKRFEELRSDMNKRFEQVDQRFAETNKLMIGIVSAFAAIVAVTIAFALWDRRTMIRPFEDRSRKLEEDIAEDKEKLKALISALREYAKKDSHLAEILKSFSIL